LLRGRYFRNQRVNHSAVLLADVATFAGIQAVLLWLYVQLWTADLLLGLCVICDIELLYLGCSRVVLLPKRVGLVDSLSFVHHRGFRYFVPAALLLGIRPSL